MRSIEVISVPIKELWRRNSERHGWCEITPLSGDYEENIFMATFADDYRSLFEVNGGVLSLLMTQDQENNWAEMTEEEQQGILEEIFLFYLVDIEKKGD